LLAAACSYTGSATGPGVVTFATPGVIPPIVVIAPSGARAAAAPSAAPAPRQGAYAGSGQVLDDPGGACGEFVSETRHGDLPPANVFTPGGASGAVRVDNFVVNGDSVSMGPFQGGIRPDGSVMLQSGQAYLLGRFVGSDFVGRYWRPQPGCTYSMVLRPVA